MKTPKKAKFHIRKANIHFTPYDLNSVGGIVRNGKCKRNPSNRNSYDLNQAGFYSKPRRKNS